MRYSIVYLVFCTLFLSELFGKGVRQPSHFMLSPGIFNVDKEPRRFMIQGEYRWELDCHHVRPLVSGFITTEASFFICGGVAYDIFLLKKKVVVTPSFAPGIYAHGYGKKLGFPLNFRSSIDFAWVLPNKGRFGVQFYHISNAHILWKNPGVDNLVVFYAIPIPR